MEKQSKPRLSDVTKKTTVDRASKLVAGLLPPMDPIEPSVAAQPAPVTEPLPVEAPAVKTAPEVSEQAAQPAPVTDPPSAAPASVALPKERSRKSTAALGISEIVNQPVPEGTRCTHLIMLSDVHHQMLRELSFKHNKNMTKVLYNLLESIRQREE